MLDRNDPHMPFYISIAALILSVTVSTTSVAYTVAATRANTLTFESALEKLPKPDDSKADIVALERAVGAHGRIMHEMVKGLKEVRQDYTDRLGKIEGKIDAIPTRRR